MLHIDNNLDNPFIISKIIPEPLFCDRDEETSYLIKQIVNGRNVVLISPRRMGKTGLIHHLFRQPEISKKYITFFIDIYSTTSLQEFCYTFGKAVFEQLKPKKKQYWESFVRTIKSLQPGISIDAITGEPRFDLGIGAISNPTATLEEIFTYLESAPKPCIVAFDEFQQISDFPEKRVEALLRGFMQNCSKTSFIFSGSKQHTMSQMFHSKARPFYQSAQIMELKPLKKEVYSQFAKRLFKKHAKTLDTNVVEQIYEDFEGTTWYMQMLMNELFAITKSGGTCTQEQIPIAKNNIIEVQEGSYQMQMSNLSQKQKALLQAIAREGQARAITSAAFVKRHALNSPSSVQSSVKGLIEKDVVSADNGCYRISDYFFSEWIKKTF